MSEDLYRSLDELYAEAITNNTSIFDLPLARLFLKRHKEELNDSAVWGEIKDCVSDMINEYASHCDEIPQSLGNDIEAIHLAHSILMASEEDFEKIEWLK